MRAAPPAQRGGGADGCNYLRSGLTKLLMAVDGQPFWTPFFIMATASCLF